MTLWKKPLYSGYSTGFTLQIIFPAYKVCLKKKSFLERWNSGYFTNKLNIKNGEHGNWKLVQESSHELKVKSYFNVIWSCKQGDIKKIKQQNFFALKRAHGVTHVWQRSQYLKMRCLVISVCQWHGDREKNQLFSPGAYPRMGHIRKCFLSPAIPQGLWLKTHIQETSRWRRSTKLTHPLQKKISLVLGSFYFATEA